MAKITKNYDGSVAERSTLGDAFAVVDHYVGDLFGIAWKLGLFYGAWISLAYYAMTTASSPQAVQITAIGYWFGWLFLGATIALGILVTLLGMLDRVRLARSKRKY